jgi:hypothetical protein
LLGFAWSYSSESGLFNGLRRKKYEKFPSPFASPPAVAEARPSISRVGKRISRILIFAKKLLQEFAGAAAPDPGSSDFRLVARKSRWRRG